MYIVYSLVKHECSECEMLDMEDATNGSILANTRMHMNHKKVYEVAA